MNTIIINLQKKEIAIFDPWGRNGKFKEVYNYYTKIKIDVLNNLFNSFKFYIYDISIKFNINGPQDTELHNTKTKITNYDFKNPGGGRAP